MRTTTNRTSSASIGVARWIGWLICAVLCLLDAGPSFANPQGMSVAQGTATAARSGLQLNVTASRNAVINWQSFNIAAGEATRFFQPSATSVVWNRILDQNPSQIWGSLQGNGVVVLMNQNGFYFGPNSSVTAAGFIAAAAAVAPPPDVGGGLWSFQGPPPSATIINYGQISVASGGSLFLIAQGIENHGVLSAPDGNLGLFAGKQVMISDRPDGRGLSAAVQLPAGAIDNSGRLIADAGSIALIAQVVNQNGLVQANSLRSHNGVIELIASDTVNLGPGSVLEANGDSTGVSGGGKITVKSAQTFTDDPASVVRVRGGASGGNGGALELSAPNMLSINSQLDGTAQSGWRNGSLVLDPKEIVLNTSGSGSTPSGTGTVDVGDDSGQTLTLNINKAFVGFSQITLQASDNITLANNTKWNLNSSTGISAPGSLLTLEAGNNIIIGNNAKLQAGQGWSVDLSAGVNFSSPTLAVTPGTGGIYVNSTGGNISGIEAYDGAPTGAAITLNAGKEVVLGNGFIHTIGGGSINITTGTGDVNAGKDASGYIYSTNPGYTVSGANGNNLGGIGTANGGNVIIDAGGNILSLNATIGAFGAQPGNVTLTAGGNIQGGFMLRNGTGTLTAGGNIGSASVGASFGLISGGWNITAGGNLYMNEVYNPNGALNSSQVPGAENPFLYDYAPNAYVNLVGGNSVQLMGEAPALASDNSDAGRQPIYPPILSISAGVGGITLANNLVLYPSPQGMLIINDLGALSSTVGSYYEMVVSDSSSPKYGDFMGTHAASPIHLGENSPVMQVVVQGDLDNVLLDSPGEADVHIYGNTKNFGFLGQNLSASDITTLRIDGNYTTRSPFTTVDLTGTTDYSIFYNPNDPQLVAPAARVLAGKLSFNPATGQLTVNGRLTQQDLNFLLNPYTYVLDPLTGGLEVNPVTLKPVTVPATFTTDTAAIQQLYTESQDASGGGGLQIGGPGHFNIYAGNMDLGVTSGIRSVGALINPNLASVMFQGGQVLPGADILVQLTGNLDITSSQIASFSGGSITINSLGAVDVGSQTSLTSDSTPKGIYTAHGGDVTVTAVNDVLVNGSRIASYDGGNVTVTSEYGNVDAGAGAKGFFEITTSYIDPATGQATFQDEPFFGSGIMATTRTSGDATVGNVIVQAGGSILASSGGILQIAFNKADQSAATLVLDAKGDIIANQSGVLGRNVTLDAGGKIQGLVVASGNLDVHAVQSVTVTALAGGTANVSGSSVSGLVAGGGEVSVAGVNAGVSEISTGAGASANGSQSSGNSAFAGVSAAPAQKTVEDPNKAVAAPTDQTNAEDERRRLAGAKSPVLAHRVGRVTVILPQG